MPCGYPKELTLNKKSVTTALKKNKGVYLHACKLLNVDRSTLSRFVNEHPDLKKLVIELRTQFEEDLLDACEDVLSKLIKKIDTDPTNALKSAIYTLNNKGKRRGYAHPDADRDHDKMTPAQAKAVAKFIEEERKKQDKKLKGATLAEDKA